MHILTPNTKKIRIRNEVDRFGFSYILSNQMHLGKTPKSHCRWVHGWKWFDIKREKDVGVNIDDKKTPIVVPNRQMYNFFINKGFENTIIGGLPFAYVKRKSIKKIKNSVIIILPKSQYYTNINKSFFTYIEYINKNLDLFGQNPFFCIFGSDADRPDLINFFNKKKLNYIIGARYNDRNALYRMHDIFSQFEYCASSTLGSHIVYASLMGVKCSIIGPYSRPLNNLDVFLDDVCSENYAKDKFSWLFKKNVFEGELKKNWAQNECGCNNLLEDEILKKTLGWTFGTKFIGYTNSLKRKLNIFTKF